MNPIEQIDQMLKATGAILKRRGKHEVWKLPNGRSFVRSKTPSDHRCARNQIRDLRRAVAFKPGACR